MKKLITLLILLFAINISAQDQSTNVMSRYNYSATALDSAGIYTGTTELVRGYNSISVNVKSNRDGYYKVLFGNNSTLTTSNATRIDSIAYEENDVQHSKTFGVVSPYFKIIYYNAPYAQTSFNLIVMLNRGEIFQRDVLGVPKVTIEGSPTAGEYLATTAKQDSVITLFGSVKTTIEFASSSTAIPTEWFGLTDTVTTRVDTTIISGHDSFIRGYIKADDSVEVSIVGDFASGHTWIITETTAVPLEWAINQQWTKLYIRRYGSAGTPRFYLRLSAY